MRTAKVHLIVFGNSIYGFYFEFIVVSMLAIFQYLFEDKLCHRAEASVTGVYSVEWGEEWFVRHRLQIRNQNNFCTIT